MTPERLATVERLYHEARACPSEERGAFLNKACAGDEDLRHEVQSLISTDASTQDFLEVPALEVAAAWIPEEPTDPLLGMRLGPYRIEARLGSGGMGKVYRAEDTTLDRKVAIKLLLETREEDEPARRGQIEEAKKAARLDHPNVCGVYGFETHAGHSFIVMQYVEGETLSTTMRDRPLGVAASIDVAIHVADALSHAHSRGIVHRDIKPWNIMITPQGQVTVLDFGVAKNVPVDPAARTTQAGGSELSSPGLVVGTAPYMSPEQAKGGAIDARSDLFSLGAVLYECVTGRPAFGGGTPMEICARVIHVDPPPPSATNPDVPPGLDRVILTALAKDRDLRYQSAEALRSELAAVRDSLGAPDPPRVARGGWAAPLVGLARRPLVLVPAVLLLLAALTLPVWRRATPYRPTPEALQWYERGTSALRDGTYYTASKAFEQAIALDGRFALAHARLAEAWSELDYADHASREILQARSLVRDLSPLPALDALYLQAVTHVVLGEFGSAVDVYQQITERAPDMERAHAYVDLGRTQEKNDDTEKARDSYEHASALTTRDAAPYLRLGILRGRQQDLDGARQAFQTAEALYRTLSNVEGEAEVFYQRGFLFVNLRQLSEARTQLDQSLALSGNPVNPNQQVRTLLALSSVSAAEGDSSQAEQQAADAIQLARDNGIENQATSGLNWLGNVFLNRGEYAEAEKRYTEALELARRDNGRLNEAVALFSLGSLRSQQRRTDEALRYVEQALPILQQAGYRKWRSQALMLLGRLHLDRGEYEAALAALEEEFAGGERVGDVSQVALARTEIGRVRVRQERYPEALAHFHASETISRSLNDTASVGYALMERAGVLWQLGRFDEARTALDEAAAIAGTGGADRQLLAEIRTTEARLELGAGRFRESKRKAQQALDLAGDQYADTVVQAALTLGLAETRSGGARAATRACARALEAATGTRDPWLISSAQLALAEALLDHGEPRRALDLAQRALEGFARFGQLDSEWRAWLIASGSKQQLGEAATAREDASIAAARLASLEQRLGQEAYERFRTRPDVGRFHRRLEKHLTP